MAEFKRWSPGIRVVRYHGPLAERRRLQNDDASFGNFDVIVTSYEVVAGDEEFFRYKFIWQYVIVDEGHRIVRDLRDVASKHWELFCRHALTLVCVLS